MSHKKLVAVVIPVYKAELTLTDVVAMRQLRKVLGNYPLYFIHPESLQLAYEELETGIGKEVFADIYFQSVTGYSALMLSAELYDRFAAYE